MTNSQVAKFRFIYLLDKVCEMVLFRNLWHRYVKISKTNGIQFNLIGGSVDTLCIYICLNVI